MSEEIVESAPEAVLLSVVAVDGDSVKDAARLRLEIEGPPGAIAVFTELNLAYIQAAFGDSMTLIDAEGNAVSPPKPYLVDPLREDEPAA